MKLILILMIFLQACGTLVGNHNKDPEEETNEIGNGGGPIQAPDVNDMDPGTPGEIEVADTEQIERLLKVIAAPCGTLFSQDLLLPSSLSSSEFQDIELTTADNNISVRIDEDFITVDNSVDDANGVDIVDDSSINNMNVVTCNTEQDYAGDRSDISNVLYFQSLELEGSEYLVEWVVDESSDSATLEKITVTEVISESESIIIEWDSVE